MGIESWQLYVEGAHCGWVECCGDSYAAMVPWDEEPVGFYLELEAAKDAVFKAALAKRGPQWTSTPPYLWFAFWP